MIRLLFDFHAGRYHATPWGHHVNEGLVEWPPSPWRIIRALLATGYTKFGWQAVPNEMRKLVEAFSKSEPSFMLPPATEGHTRHYMPVKGWKKGVQATSLVVDAFVRPGGPLGVEWPTTLGAEQHELLTQLLARLSYLGRAESRVKARLVSEEEFPAGMPVSTQRRERDDEPVRLLMPMASSEYERWRAENAGAAEDIVSALCVDTSELQKSGWNVAPGSRELVYWRPAGAFALASAGGPISSDRTCKPTTALFALATDKKRDVLPLMERSLPTMALFRRALLSKVGDDQARGKCPDLAGKDERGEPLRSRGHGHAHFIPLSLDRSNRGRIDHVLVHAGMGFGEAAQGALRSLRKTWSKGIDELAVTLIGLGPLGSFLRVGSEAIPELAEGTTWASWTPFVPPRHTKPRGRDALENQVRAELERRGLPGLVELRIFLPTRDESGTGSAPRFRHFTRSRQGKAIQAPPGLYRVVLTLEARIAGPLCLGWGSHFGLGLFRPAAHQEGSTFPENSP